MLFYIKLTVNNNYLEGGYWIFRRIEWDRHSASILPVLLHSSTNQFVLSFMKIWMAEAVKWTLTGVRSSEQLELGLNPAEINFLAWVRSFLGEGRVWLILF